MTSIITSESCTEKCKSLQHGREICAILTKEGRTDEEVLALIKKTCRNFHKIKDEFNRTALHLASSTGRPKVVEWLVKREGCDINMKDFSGYTALHRSIFFGHIDVTRTLIKLGASLNVSDNEGYFPLDMFRLDRPKYTSDDKQAISEVYVWGNNENYNLGTGTETPRSSPELLDRNRRLPWGHLGSCFTQIAMSPFHTVWLHWSSEVYSCGYGVGGRLGHDNENLAFTPQRIDFRNTERCVEVAVGLDHSLFRMESGAVKSCGSNEYSVLGQKQPLPKALKPRVVDLTSKSGVIGIAASRFHSVFLTKTEVFTCGINFGQMGMDETIKTIAKPRKIVCPFEKEKQAEGNFTHVACNEWSTVVAHNRGNVCIFKKFGCTTLNTRHFDIEKIQVVGGGNSSATNLTSQDKSPFNSSSTGPHDSDSNFHDIPLAVFILLKHGRLLIWHENQEQLFTLSSSSSSSSNTKKSGSSSTSPQFTLAVFNVGRALTITDFCVNANSLILINRGGEAFKAPLNLRANPTLLPNMHATSSASDQWGFMVKDSLRHKAGKDPYSFMMLEPFKVKRINNIYAALKTYCDPRGNNFAITQVHQKADILNLPTKMKTAINENFELLLKETSIDDEIHDVRFKVGSFQFPAHAFVVASRCEVLYRDVKKKFEEMESSTAESPSPVVITIKNVEPRIFELVLQFLYSNQCDIFFPGKFACYPNDPDWVELLKSYAKKLQLRSLVERLNSCNIRLQNGQIEMSRTNTNVPVLKFDKNSHSSLCDVILVSEDGFEVRAHQCVIVARLEYYKNMLQRNVWFEGSQSTSKLKFPGSKAVMDIFLDIIYRGDYNPGSFGGMKDLDMLTQALVTSDLLLSPEFLSHFEYLIVDYLSHENVSELLNLSICCNAPQLRQGCIEFICLNLAPIMENRLLDCLPDEVVQDIGRYYRSSSFAEIMIRKLKDTSAPPDEMYISAKDELNQEMAEDFELLDHIEEAEFITPKKSQSSKGKLKMRSRTLSSSSANNDNIGVSPNQTTNRSRYDSNEYNDDYSYNDNSYNTLSSSFESTFDDFTTIVSKASAKSSNNNAFNHQHSPPSLQTRATKISIPLPSHTLNLSTKIQAQTQQQPVSLSSGLASTKPISTTTTTTTLEATKVVAQPIVKIPTKSQLTFSESDFPTFGEMESHVHKRNNNENANKKFNAEPRNSTIGTSASSSNNSQRGRAEAKSPAIKSNSSSSSNGVVVHQNVASSSSASKKKTKWVNLEEKVNAGPKSHPSNSNGDSPSSGRDLKNPWCMQKVQTPVKNSLQEENSVNSVKFDDIVQRERMKNQNLEKVKAKPLYLHQIEDEAINQLWQRYGKNEDVLNGYELLHVERAVVTSDYAVPTWGKFKFHSNTD